MASSPGNAVAEIRIERIKIKNLVDFAKNVLSQGGDGHFVPITMQRAIAQSRNPYATGEEVGMLAAYAGSELVGYFGIMPIRIKAGEAESTVHWFTTWLVSPRFRGKAVGSLLMKEALTMGLDFMIVGSGPARKVCRRFGFLELPPLRYAELDMRATKRINPIQLISRVARKIFHPFGIKISPNNAAVRFYDRATGRLFKKLVYRVLRNGFSRQLVDFQIKEVQQVQEQDYAPSAGPEDAVLYRGAEIVNWMLKFPWISEPGSSASEFQDYYFSDVRPFFKQFALEITKKNQGEEKAILVFSISNIGTRRVMKVLDRTQAERPGEGAYLPVLLKYARQHNVDRIELPWKLGRQLQPGWLQKILLHKRERVYQCSPAGPDTILAQNWNKLRLEYSDGDMAFT